MFSPLWVSCNSVIQGQVWMTLLEIDEGSIRMLACRMQGSLQAKHANCMCMWLMCCTVLDFPFPHCLCGRPEGHDNETSQCSNHLLEILARVTDNPDSLHCLLDTAR
jgi:hypothetical protein